MTAGRPLPAWLRAAPNVLSGARALAVPVLFVLALEQLRIAFTWVLIPALLSDIFDGWIARAFHVESRIGAALDSVADSLMLFVAVFGIWVFHPEVIRDHAWLCGTAVGLWALEDVLALLRYRRLSSFHTYLSKIVANLLGVFVGWLFLSRGRCEHRRKPRGTRPAQGVAAVAGRRARPVVGVARGARPMRGAVANAGPMRRHYDAAFTRVATHPPPERAATISGSSLRPTSPCRPAAGSC